MKREEIKTLFDKQAAGYDSQWARMAPIRNCLHYLLESVFCELPAEARILCVGAGTGAELLHLADKFPGWRFTVVEPSGAMLNVCRARTEELGLADRCQFHEGFLDSFATADAYDAATCFLVSQFIIEREDRTAFFHEIAVRLKPAGILASADLTSDVEADVYADLLKTWLNVMAGGGVTSEGIERMRNAYNTDVAVLPPAEVAAIIKTGGFTAPVQFFQAGLIRGWYMRRV